ncbi:hypothetical protein [Pseudactinotalea sp. HY160]|uniref:hypothetical protein n=1 Tax=Pseudactinotalea sp. HY160 TaxID=2654490 RepID=UPI001883DB42|nr:hypothetical protein [Pseudactinotalea sp. HY160]
MLTYVLNVATEPGFVIDEAETIWRHLDELPPGNRLDGRLADALFDALLGLRVTRPTGA